MCTSDVRLCAGSLCAPTARNSLMLFSLSLSQLVWGNHIPTVVHFHRVWVGPVQGVNTNDHDVCIVTCVRFYFWQFVSVCICTGIIPNLSSCFKGKISFEYSTKSSYMYFQKKRRKKKHTHYISIMLNINHVSVCVCMCVYAAYIFWSHISTASILCSFILKYRACSPAALPRPFLFFSFLTSSQHIPPHYPPLFLSLPFPFLFFLTMLFSVWHQDADVKPKITRFISFLTSSLRCLFPVSHNLLSQEEKTPAIYIYIYLQHYELKKTVSPLIYLPLFPI